MRDCECGAKDQELEQIVEGNRITLVDNQNEEYEFLILDEFEYQEKLYLAMASCDEKTDMGSGSDPGESNDITVVRMAQSEGVISFFAVTDADELYGVSKMVHDRFDHLGSVNP